MSSIEAPITDCVESCLTLWNELVWHVSTSKAHREAYEEGRAGFRLWGRTMGVFKPSKSTIEWILRHNVSTQRAILELVKAILANLRLCARVEGVASSQDAELLVGSKPHKDRPETSDTDSVASSSSSEGMHDSDGRLSNTQEELEESYKSAIRSINDNVDLLIRISILVHHHGAAKIDSKASKWYPDDLEEFQAYAESSIKREVGLLRFDEDEFAHVRKKLVDSVIERWRRVSYRIKYTKIPAAETQINPEPEATSYVTKETPAVAVDPRPWNPQVETLPQQMSLQSGPVQSNVHLSSVATSFALSKAPIVKAPASSKPGSLAEAKDLDIPRPPRKAIEDFQRTRRGFLCPYCRVLQRFDPSRSRMWREHVMHDLTPYFCLHSDCPSPEVLFDNSKSWKQHMRYDHAPWIWRCHECTAEQPAPALRSKLPLEFESEQNYILHMEQNHNPPLSTDEILALSKLGVRRRALDVTECIICGQDSSEVSLATGSGMSTASDKQEALLDHMRQHLQSLALISLPWDANGQDTNENLSEVTVEAQSTETSKEGAQDNTGEESSAESEDTDGSDVLPPDMTHFESASLSKIRSMFPDKMLSSDIVRPWMVDTDNEITTDISGSSRLLHAMTEAHRYPLNMTDLIPDTDRGRLQDISAQFNQQSERLFCRDSSNVHLDIWQIYERDKDYEQLNISNAKDLEELLKTPIFHGRFDPLERIFFIQAPHSRASLNITERMFLQILTYHTAMLAFLDSVDSFGKQEPSESVDKARSIRFKSENQFISAPMTFQLPELGRTGRYIRLCYTLASAEKNGRRDSDIPYSIRFCAVHHSYDLQSERSTWIIIKATNKLIADRIKSELDHRQGLRQAATGSRPSSLDTALSVHTLIAAWANEDWKSYLQLLGSLTDERADLSSRDSRRRLQYLTEVVNEAALILRSNRSVLQNLMHDYSSLTEEDALGNARSPYEEAADYVRVFVARVEAIAEQLQACISEAEELLSNLAQHESTSPAATLDIDNARTHSPARSISELSSSVPRGTSAMQELRQWMEEHAVPSYDITEAKVYDDIESCFFPAGLVESIFQTPSDQYWRTQRLLQEVFHSEDAVPVTPRLVSERCSRVLCILVLIERPEMIGFFARQESLWDNQLPFHPHSPPADFPKLEDRDLYESFIKFQWSFCAPLMDNIYGAVFKAERILPFCRDSTSISHEVRLTQHRVQLDPEHDYLIKSRSGQSAKSYILKTFSSFTFQKDIEKERAAFDNLNYTHGADGPSPEGIISCFMSFCYRDTLNLILENVDCNLDDYFSTHSPPTLANDIVQFWESFFEIVKGVRTLHERGSSNITTDRWHLDLKPENIFIVSSKGKLSFKVGSLDICHFGTVLGGVITQLELDKFGIQEYLPPECFNISKFHQDTPDASIKAVDIWSLGCILAETSVWLVKAEAGLENFRRSRRLATTNTSPHAYDYFHDGGQLLPEIRTQLLDLKHDFKPDDYITGRVIDVMIGQMLEADPELRPNAKQLQGTAQTVLNNSRADLSRLDTWISNEKAQEESLQRSRLSAASRQSIDMRSGSNEAVRGRDKGNEAERSRERLQMVIEEEEKVPRENQAAIDTETERLRELYGTGQIPKYDSQESRPAQAPPRPHSALRRASETAREPFVHPSLRPDVKFDSESGSASMGASQTHATATSTSWHRHSEAGLGVWDDVSDTVEPASISDLSVPHWERTELSSAINTNSVECPIGCGGFFEQDALDAHMTRCKGLSNTRALPEGIDSSTKERTPTVAGPVSHANVPYCSVGEAQTYWLKKKSSDPAARLPHAELMDMLKDRDHVFMIDDSDNMYQHWTEVAELAKILTYLVKETDLDGVDLLFMCYPEKRYKCKTSTKMKQLILDHRIPERALDSWYCLRDEFQEYQKMVEGSSKRSTGLLKWPSTRNSPRKRTIYILTCWVSEYGLTKIVGDIMAAEQMLLRNGRAKGDLGIQVISFGNDKGGLELLEKLDRLDLKLDIVDVEPSTGNVWKMLLGSISPTFDDDPKQDVPYREIGRTRDMVNN